MRGGADTDRTIWQPCRLGKIKNYKNGFLSQRSRPNLHSRMRGHVAFIFLLIACTVHASLLDGIAAHDKPKKVAAAQAALQDEVEQDENNIQDARPALLSGIGGIKEHKVIKDNDAEDHDDVASNNQEDHGGEQNAIEDHANAQEPDGGSHAIASELDEDQHQASKNADSGSIAKSEDDFKDRDFSVPHNIKSDNDGDVGRNDDNGHDSINSDAKDEGNTDNHDSFSHANQAQVW